ncbi:MAG: hypothetical protein HYU69_00800 [Bacteroidetes bacterium]|nr:hypothetical protein [Bacteroidota bacterium]
MKTPSDDLFILIKSLTPVEKRYFKVFSTIHSENSDKSPDKKYIILFNAIDRLKIYDEKKLKANLKDNTLKKHLKVFKSYVSEAILKSLGKYHSTDSIEIILAQKLQQTEILIGKGLHTMALKIVKRFLKMAIEHEKTIYVMLFMMREWELVVLSEEVNKLKVGAEQGLSEIFNCLNTYKDELEYKQLMHRVWPLLKMKNENDNELKSKFKRVVAHPLIQNFRTENFSYESIKSYYLIITAATRISGDLENSYLFRKKYVEFIESDKLKMPNRVLDYLRSVHNLLIIIDKLKKFDEFEACLKKVNKFMDELNSKYKTNQVLIQYLSHNILSVKHYIRMHNYERALAIAGDTERSMKNITLPDTSTQILFHYYAVLINFYLSDFRLALKHLNKLLSYDNSWIKQDLIHSVRIIFLIVYYELGREDLLISQSKSIRRYLHKKRGYINKHEEVWLELFEKKIHKAKTNTHLVSLFSETKVKMQKVLKDKEEAKSAVYFDYISWLDSKIGNKPFVEIAKRKELER